MSSLVKCPVLVGNCSERLCSGNRSSWISGWSGSLEPCHFGAPNDALRASACSPLGNQWQRQYKRASRHAKKNGRRGGEEGGGGDGRGGWQNGAALPSPAALEVRGRPRGEAATELLVAGSRGRHFISREGRDTTLEPEREVVGTRSLDPPSAVDDSGIFRVAENPIADDAPSLRGRYCRLPLQRRLAPKSENRTARRVHGGCRDRHREDWEPSSSPRSGYPLPPTRGGRRTVDESCWGPLGVPPYPMSDGVVCLYPEETQGLQVDIEATTGGARAGLVWIRPSHI
ncbi:hypothetical protein NDU88_006305 [Pleurodeles waltl]|uniref:Uncharacterized protein n=1 Tax=Pleurodeles waltl TaxID=8319 RepID=A0AAV7VNT3_PLEWA|nr:hypothetical protein NDU88_006305 [Pleurodeles waltl]